MKLAELFPPQFGSLPDDVEKNSSEWKSVSDQRDNNQNGHLTSSMESWLLTFFSLQWYDLDAPEQAPYPMKYQENLSAFQKLLLLRCFRVDRVYRAGTDYVTVTMGEKWACFYSNITVTVYSISLCTQYIERMYIQYTTVLLDDVNRRYPYLHRLKSSSEFN